MPRNTEHTMIALFTSPLGWAFLLAAAGSIGPATIWPAAWVLLLACASPLGARAASAPLVRLGRSWPAAPEWAGRETPDAILVFSGGIEGTTAPRAALTPASWERLVMAVGCARRWPGALVIFSGARTVSGGASSAGLMRDEAVRLGVDPKRCVVETASRTTRESAVESAKLLGRLGASRVTVVTSAVHMARARAALWKEGQGSTGVSAPHPLSGSVKVRSLLPQASALARTTWAVHEWLALGWYAARGWIGSPRPEPVRREAFDTET